jgi:hypothetical protein
MRSDREAVRAWRDDRPQHRPDQDNRNRRVEARSAAFDAACEGMKFGRDAMKAEEIASLEPFGKTQGPCAHRHAHGPLDVQRLGIGPTEPGTLNGEVIGVMETARRRRLGAGKRKKRDEPYEPAPPVPTAETPKARCHLLPFRLVSLYHDWRELPDTDGGRHRPLSVFRISFRNRR